MALSFQLETNRPTQIGIIALQADESLEPDLRRLLPNTVEYLVTRVPSDVLVTQETLRAMEDKLTDAARLFPRGAQVSAVAYGCTSASAVIGPNRIADLVKAGVPTPAVTQPLSALIAACQHLGVRRIGLVSPYVEAVSETLRTAMTDAGLEVVAFASFDVAEEDRVVRISGKSIEDAAIAVAQETDCDAIFLSCTNLRTLHILEQIEARLNMPVLSSNQALAWHIGQLAGFSADMNGVGRLFAA
jgi:maleate isomerase